MFIFSSAKIQHFFRISKFFGNYKNIFIGAETEGILRDRNKRNNRNNRNKHFRERLSANNYYYNNYLVLLANTAKITYLFFCLLRLLRLLRSLIKWLFFKLLNQV